MAKSAPARQCHRSATPRRAIATADAMQGAQRQRSRARTLARRLLMHTAMKSIAAVMVGLAGLVVATSTARADTVALFADGHGGIASGGASETSAAAPSTAGLGYRLGARVLLLEGYFDHTGFGGGG